MKLNLGSEQEDDAGGVIMPMFFNFDMAKQSEYKRSK